MLKLTPIKTTDPGYEFVEELMHYSFPEVERRDNEAQRRNTDHNSLFTVNLVTDEDEDGNLINVGFITVWTFEDFHYLEHFATDPKIRNKGYGKKIMSQLLDSISGLIVLEVEEPEDELTSRRVAFYERCGFKICPNDYIQPAYRPEGESIPLKIMFKGIESLDERFTHVRDTLYREVYLAM